jgi:hypothetical protein
LIKIKNISKAGCDEIMELNYKNLQAFNIFTPVAF